MNPPRIQLRSYPLGIHTFHVTATVTNGKVEVSMLQDVRSGVKFSGPNEILAMRRFLAGQWNGLEQAILDEHARTEAER